MQSRRALAIACPAFLLCVTFLGACNGRAPTTSAPITGQISGIVAHVAAATVSVYPIDGFMNRGTVLASGPTASDGTFTLTIPAYNGPVEVVAFGGTYPEEAVNNVPVQLTHEWSTVIPTWTSGSDATVTLSPVSAVVRSLAKAAAARGMPLADAVDAAWMHANNHFGGLDWRTVRPTSVTPSQTTTVTWNDATKAAIILAGISSAARAMAESSSLSPGTSVTSATLAGAAADDAADGTLDGSANATAIMQGSTPLSTFTWRRGLGQGILRFIASSFNKTQLTTGDVLSLAATIAGDSDPYLFCPGQTAAPTCAGTSLQLQPPVLEVQGESPSFVSSSAVTLHVGASAPYAGVSAVFAQTAAGARVAGTASGGTWTLPSIPLVEGPNLISLWGVDGTGAGQIGDGITITVVRDLARPTPFVSAATASYYDERALTLTSPAVPATYAFPAGAQRVSAIAGVFKAATRLSWTTTPTPTLLEGANPDNVPWIQFGVPVSSTWAPTQSATYSIDDGSQTYTGDLIPWRSTATTSDMEFYDLPLTANLIPSLAAATTNPVTLAVTVTVTDAAGNRGATSFAVPFTIVGPPVHVAEDTAYPDITEPMSTYGYRVANGNYGELWNPTSSALRLGEVRLVRYVVSNPSPYPIAIRADVVGSPVPWRMQEGLVHWDAGNYFGAGGGTLNIDGFTYFDMDIFCQTVTSTGSGCGASTGSYRGERAEPCGVRTTYAHNAGDTLHPYACDVYSYDGTTVTSRDVSTASLGTSLFGPAAPNANETTRPAASGDYAVVPPGAGSAPGTLALYVTRQLSIPRGPTIAWNATTSRHEALDQVLFHWVWGNTTWTSGNANIALMGYKPSRGMAYVARARETLDGTLTVTSRGLVGATPLGTEQPAYSASVSRTLSTAH